MDIVLRCLVFKDADIHLITLSPQILTITIDVQHHEAEGLGETGRHFLGRWFFP